MSKRFQNQEYIKELEYELEKRNKIIEKLADEAYSFSDYEMEANHSCENPITDNDICPKCIIERIKKELGFE